jgi:hypothetical protein
MSLSLPLVRNIVLGTTSFFALIVLGLGGYTFTQTANSLGIDYAYSALGVSTSVLHLVSVSAVLIIGSIRDGAFTSRVSYQVGWLSYLSIMWLATGAQAAATLNLFFSCSPAFCGATQGIVALGFINWAILSGYVLTLTTAAIRAGQAGKTVWTIDVKDLRWAPGLINREKIDIDSLNPAVGAYPPQVGVLSYGTPPITPQPQPTYPQADYPQSNYPQPGYPQPTQPSYPPPQPNYQYGGAPPV